MISYSCPGCSQGLRVKDDLAGRSVRCPRCGQVSPVVAAPVGSGESTAATLAVPPAPQSSRTAPLENSAGATGAQGPLSNDTQPEGAGQGPGGSRPALDFLAPAEGPGELGRLGPYRVLKVLGTGGMGVVLQAEDIALRRPVALKAMLPSASVGTTSARERFLQEARAAAAIEHDHIVTIYQVGEDRGVPFLAMQFLHGESLEQRLQREGKVPVKDLLRIGREVAEGLAAAHARGLIHRDVKPANIWLDAQQQGRVRLLDFGLARVVSEQTHLTQTGVVLGTPAYMAPEQAAGEESDGRADLFSLGCVLYRMATGQPAFAGRSVISILRAVAFSEPKTLCEQDSGLPRPLSDLVKRLLAKRPALRPSSAREVADALRQLEQGQSVAAHRSGPPPVPPPAPSVFKPVPVVATPVATVTPLPDLPRRRGRRQGTESSEDSEARSGLWPWFLLGGGFLVIVGVAVAIGLVLVRQQPEVQPPVAAAKVPPVVQPAPPPPLPVVEPLPLLRQLEGHAKGVWAVAIAADGKRGLSASRDGEVCLWDLHTGDRIRRFLGHTSDVTGLAFAPDGKRFLSSSKDGLLRLWDVEAGETVRLYRGHVGAAWCVAFSKDGKRAASGESNGTVHLWDAKTGRELVTCVGHTGAVRVVAFSPDDSLLLSASEDRTLRLWRTDTGTEIRRFVGHNGIVYGAAISPDGRQILSGSADRTLRLWDLATANEIQRFVGHTNEVNGVAFTPDGRHALSVSDDQTVRVWEVASGNELYRGAGHRLLVFAIAVAADGRSALSGGFDGQVRLWDLSMLAGR
jgi:serine/threonine protein kinase